MSSQQSASTGSVTILTENALLKEISDGFIELSEEFAYRERMAVNAFESLMRDIGAGQGGSDI